MKIKLYRQSGDPVALENREHYKREFQEMYDKCAEEAGLDMLKLHESVAAAETELVKKWNAEVEVELPKTQRAWDKLISQYEDTPLMLAKAKNGKYLVLILMDSLNG
jgi:hypothetical protein